MSVAETLEFITENFESNQIHTRAAPLVATVAGVVVADVVGAAVGLVGGLIWDEITDDGVLSGWEGPGKAINGAIAGSTGVAGAVGR